MIYKHRFLKEALYYLKEVAKELIKIIFILVILAIVIWLSILILVPLPIYPAS